MLDLKCYKCDRCGYSSERRLNLLSHLNRQTECEPKFSSVSRSILISKYSNITIPSKKTHACTYCMNQFCSSWSLDRHIGICKVKHPELQKNKKKEVENASNLVTMIQTLHNEIRDLKASLGYSKESLITNNTLNNTQNNNVVQNNTAIQVNCIGNENVSYISDRDDYEQYMWACISSTDNMIKFFKHKYVNDAHPENKCIKRVQQTTVNELNDQVEFIDQNNKKRRMEMQEFVLRYGYQIYKQVIQFCTTQVNELKLQSIDYYTSEENLFGKTPYFCPNNKARYDIISKFHHNFALPIENDAGIPYNDDEIDDEKLMKKFRGICKRMLLAMETVNVNELGTCNQ